jgi:hypothetical protein
MVEPCIVSPNALTIPSSHARNCASVEVIGFSRDLQLIFLQQSSHIAAQHLMVDEGGRSWCRFRAKEGNAGDRAVGRL